MIALNELIKNIEKYKFSYQFLNCEADLDVILNLEKERKVFQLEYEDLKAKTNKLCHDLAIKKNNNELVNETYNQILKNEINIKKYEEKLEPLTKLINKNLSKLPNLPDEILKENFILNTTSKQSSLHTFYDYILKLNNYKIIEKHSNLRNINLVLKEFSNYVFENEQPIIIKNKSSFIIFIPVDNIENYINNLISYLKDNCEKLIAIKTKNIKKSSSFELDLILNRKEKIRIEIKKEFFTRKYNIKYKNTLTDMTNFFNQINIKIS